jgi:hypothetical protein
LQIWRRINSFFASPFGGSAAFALKIPVFKCQGNKEDLKAEKKSLQHGVTTFRMLGFDRKGNEE